MNYKWLKYLRRTLAVIAGGLILLFFLDIRQALPSWLHWLARVQVVPAIMAGALGVLAVLLLLTLLFGRIYCSVVCPLGILQDVILRFRKWWYRLRGQAKKLRTKYAAPINWLRYGILGLVAALFVFGITLPLALLDPYSTFGRIATSLFRPVAVWMNNIGADLLNAADNFALWRITSDITTPLVAVSSAVILVAIIVAVWRRERIVCNSVCPVGTLLGLISRYSLFRITLNTNCTNCKQCSRDCKSRCIDTDNLRVDRSRCVDCFNCLDKCKFNAISYSPSGWKEEAKAGAKSKEEFALSADGGRTAEAHADGKERSAGGFSGPWRGSRRDSRVKILAGGGGGGLRRGGELSPAGGQTAEAHADRKERSTEGFSEPWRGFRRDSRIKIPAGGGGELSLAGGGELRRGGELSPAGGQTAEAHADGKERSTEGFSEPWRGSRRDSRIKIPAGGGGELSADGGQTAETHADGKERSAGGFSEPWRGSRRDSRVKILAGGGGGGLRRGEELSPAGQSRRRFIKGSAMTLAALATSKLLADVGERLPEEPYYQPEKDLPMPPGAGTRGKFLSTCTACQLCVTRCPTQVLQPAFMEYGLRGIMMPVMKFKVESFCNFDCKVCTEVCPAGAIMPISLEEKKLTRVGNVKLFLKHCVVIEKNQDCGACAEHCPTQAVHMVPYGDAGLTQPEITPELCIGCGGCQSICPQAPAAIRVEGVREQVFATPPTVDVMENIEINDFGF